MTNSNLGHSVLAGLLIKFKDWENCRVTSDNDVYHYCMETGEKYEVDILDFEIVLDENTYNMLILREIGSLDGFEAKLYKNNALLLQGEGRLGVTDTNQAETEIRVYEEHIVDEDEVALLKLTL